MVSSILLQNMMGPQTSDPGKSYRDGQYEAKAETRKDETQASNLETAEVGRDSARTSTQKMVQDLAHDKSQYQIKDTFVALDAASSLPYEQQDIFLDNLIEEYDGHGRLGTVFKYMKVAPPEARDKIFNDLADVGVKGGYLDELYSAKYAGKSAGGTGNMAEYLNQTRQEYIDLNGKEPPASYLRGAMEDYNKQSGRQAFDRSYGTNQGKKVSDLSTEGNEIRDIEVELQGLITGSKENAKIKAQIKNNPDLLASKGIITPMQMKKSGQEKLEIETNSMIDYYMELDAIGGIINTEKSPAHNASVKALTSSIGQGTAGALGDQAQSIRQKIKNAKPLLLQGIRQSTGMSARGMDSDKEMEFYLAAVGDETKDLQSNLAALILVDELYGTRELASKIAESKSESEIYKINKSIENLEKEKDKYKKEATAKQKKLMNEASSEDINIYHTKPDDYTQDEWDYFYKKEYGFLPEEK